MSSQPRKYTKRVRAESEQQTRQRITEAAVALHGSVGPARTTISAVAEEAGVQRATVYRHFPDEESLFAACSGHWAALNPAPDLATWEAIVDPTARLRQALADTYAYYSRNETMIENVIRDRPVVAAMAKPVARRLAYLAAAVDAIVAGRPERGHARRRVRAAVGHAVAFTTWRSLVREQGLKETEAVAVMAATVMAAAAAR
jgi:AcrR family transcriptional regulator